MDQAQEQRENSQEAKKGRREAKLSLPELALIAGTRAALGAGIGLLIANKLSDGQRTAIGMTLLVIGALSTFPLAADVLGKTAASSSEDAGPAKGT